MEKHQIRYYFNLYENEITLIFSCLYKYGHSFDLSMILPLEIIHFILVLYFDIKIKSNDSIYCGSHCSFILQKDNILIGGKNNENRLGLSEKYKPDFDPDHYRGVTCYKLGRYEFNEFNAKDIQSVSFGKSHSLIVLKNGVLYGIGSNTYGQLGNEIRMIYSSPNKINISNVLSASCGNFHSMVITKEGLFSTGRNMEFQLGLGQKVQYEIGEFNKIDLLDVISIGCAGDYSMALTKEGLFGCGDNSSYPLGFDNYISETYELFSKIDLLDVISFSCGKHHSMVLTQNGLFISGKYTQKTKSSFFRKFDFSHMNVISFSCSKYCFMVLTTNGLFHFSETTGEIKDIRKKIDIKNVISFACGSNHAIIRTKEGLYGYGSNIYGQIGIGESTNIPRQIILINNNLKI